MTTHPEREKGGGMPDVSLAPETPCPHTLLVREGAAVRCDACGASASVPRCLGCREKTCTGCDDRACATCQGKPTTWIVRPPHLVCYKCGRAVPGLAQP